jgi:hypothetical protein
MKYVLLTYFRHRDGVTLADRPLLRYFSAVVMSSRRDYMSQRDRIEALREKHAALERAIDEENRRPLPNDDILYDLKRQKLRIKDEIYHLERS